MAERGPTYTNALQLKAKFQVLKDRQDLKFAALDCWKIVAELLPDGVTLDGYNFSDGRKLTLSGSAPADQTKQLLDFDADIRKATAQRPASVRSQRGRPCHLGRAAAIR